MWFFRLMFARREPSCVHPAGSAISRSRSRRFPRRQGCCRARRSRDVEHIEAASGPTIRASVLRSKLSRLTIRTWPPGYRDAAAHRGSCDTMLGTPGTTRASVFCRPRLPSRPWRFPVSDTNQDKTARTPRLTIDQSAAPASDAIDAKPEASEQHDSAANDFDEAMGLIKGTGAAIWSYAVRHPNTTLGAVAGFVLAVLVLTLGLW
ncbi:MAG: DUF2273 domain-containing protein, partial [Collinsella sp.]